MAPTTEPGSGRLWPRAIWLGLTLVVLVNLAMAWIAVRGADPVVSSYSTPQR
ncbi:MAG: hypothetical protein ABI765_00195 [Gemmatimonadota bacterium]